MQPNFVTKVSFASLKLPQTFGSPLISKESNIRSTCFPMACRSKHLHYTKLNSLSFPSRKIRFRSTAPLQMSYRFDTFMKSSTSPQNGNEENPPIRKLFNLTLRKLKKFFAFLVVSKQKFTLSGKFSCCFTISHFANLPTLIHNAIIFPFSDFNSAKAV